jgi:EamA domain-containing membrane protein RarD
LAPDHDHKTLGTLAALAAFSMWGVLVVYWKALLHVSAYEILAHRIVWSLLFTAVLLTLYRGWRDVARLLKSPRDAGLLALSSLLVSSNWLTYIWSVTHDHIVEASLGYYITPLVNVALGTLFLRERLRPAHRAGSLLRFQHHFLHDCSGWPFIAHDGASLLRATVCIGQSQGMTLASMRVVDMK